MGRAGGAGVIWKDLGGPGGSCEMPPPAQGDQSMRGVQRGLVSPGSERFFIWQL